MTGLAGPGFRCAVLGRCIDSKRAPKGRTNNAQAIGLGLQNVFGPSPEGAIYESTCRPLRGDDSGIWEEIAVGVSAPLQGLAYCLILGTQGVALGFVSMPLWG